MSNVKETLENIIRENGGVILVDKSNDHAFSVLFGVGACNKAPVADDDLFGKHILVERFFKKGKTTDIKNKLYTMPYSRSETAYLYYQKTAKTLLEFFYRNGYHEAFKESDGTVAQQLVVIERESYYDLYAYYGYKCKEGVA